MSGVLLCCLAHQAHIRAPLVGVLLCRLAHQALKGAPWVGSYSTVRCITFLMGQLFCCSAADTGVWGERGYGDGSIPKRDSAVSPSFHGCLAFLHRHFPPQSPPSHPLDKSLHSCSSPHLGIAPQSLNSSYQPLHLPGDLHPLLGYVWLQGLSDSHSI